MGETISLLLLPSLPPPCHNTTGNAELKTAKVTKFKLEIWGKAQRESARRPKSDWGKLRGDKEGGENFPGIKVTWPELKCIGICRTRFVDLG